MLTPRHIFAFSMLILFTLFLRDLPYINVFVIGKIWIVYLIILLLLLITIIKFNVSIISYVTGALLLASLVLTLLDLSFFAEMIGVFIYFSLWIIFLYKMMSQRT